MGRIRDVEYGHAECASEILINNQNVNKRYANKATS